MTIHKEGTASILLALAFFIGFNYAMRMVTDQSIIIYMGYALSTALLIIILQFFRYPHRNLTKSDELLLCPADGKVVVIEKTKEDEYFKDERIQVSIFMSPINVHANWSPMTGVVKYAKYHAGKFLVAWHPKSSTENERTTIVVANDKTVILFRQIAGALARRIKFYVQAGDKLDQGQQFGFIKFGSRVDIFLPLGTEVLVEIDQKVTGQITPLARIKS